jgi:hypothetical protein
MFRPCHARVAMGPRSNCNGSVCAIPTDPIPGPRLAWPVPRSWGHHTICSKLHAAGQEGEQSEATTPSTLASSNGLPLNSIPRQGFERRIPLVHRQGETLSHTLVCERFQPVKDRRVARLRPRLQGGLFVRDGVVLDLGVVWTSDTAAAMGRRACYMEAACAAVSSIRSTGSCLDL